MGKYNNVIDSGNIDLDQAIYRITSLKFFLGSIDKNTSYFAHPSKWKDPYDSIFMKLPCKIGDDFCEHSYRCEYFCQCWCKSTSESDAMWRLYSRDFEGIMICSTLKKVFDSIFDEKSELLTTNTYCGCVKYKKKSEFDDPLFFYKNIGNLFFDTTGKALASSLLYKIDAYRHEDEVRFIVADKGRAGDFDHKFVRHNPTFVSVVDSIVFDPNAKDDFIERVRCALQKRSLGIMARKSDLYKRRPTYYEILL